LAKGKYIVNSNKMEVHDSARTRDGCKIDEMKPEHKSYLDDFNDVKNLFDNEGYNGCKWCMPEHHTG
jgi:hypothetical protein